MEGNLFIMKQLGGCLAVWVLCISPSKLDFLAEECPPKMCNDFGSFVRLLCRLQYLYMAFRFENTCHYKVIVEPKGTLYIFFNVNA